MLGQPRGDIRQLDPRLGGQGHIPHGMVDHLVEPGGADHQVNALDQTTPGQLTAAAAGQDSPPILVGAGHHSRQLGLGGRVDQGLGNRSPR